MTLPIPDIAGIVALAYIVIKESFSLVKWSRNRINGNNHNPGRSSPETIARLDGIETRLNGIEMRIHIVDEEMVRFREQYNIINGELSAVKARCEILMRKIQ